MGSSAAMGGQMARLSAFVYGWTPMILLASYCVISFFFYIVIPPILQAVLFYIYLVLQTLTALSVSTEALQSVRPSVKRAGRSARPPRKDGARPRAVSSGRGSTWFWWWPTCPTRKDIIMRQLRYALREINYPADKLMINLVYNTPKPIEPVETELRELEKSHARLRVIKVPNSTSKADNINHYLSRSTSSAISSRFTIPTTTRIRNALRWVARRFLQGGIDIIQGRCCVYNYDERRG